MWTASHSYLSRFQNVQSVHLAILPCGVKYKIIPENKERINVQVVTREINPRNLILGMYRFHSRVVLVFEWLQFNNF